MEKLFNPYFFIGINYGNIKNYLVTEFKNKLNK